MPALNELDTQLNACCIARLDAFDDLIDNRVDPANLSLNVLARLERARGCLVALPAMDFIALAYSVHAPFAAPVIVSNFHSFTGSRRGAPTIAFGQCHSAERSLDYALNPPSIVKLAPVTKPASGPAR